MTSPISITGSGVISAAGHDKSSTLATFNAGQRPPAGQAAFPTPIHYPTFGVNRSLPALPEPYANSRSLALAMVAVRQALADAGLPESFTPTSQLRVGVCVGTTVACQLNSVSFYETFREKNKAPRQPVIDYFHANLGQSVASLIGATGPHMTVVNACSSGADAIGIAAQWIDAGLCDIAIAGGADELHRVPMAGFYSLGVMSETLCTPFDANRSGLNLGEGAGFVVLESLVHAQQRNKQAAYELAGFGAACDAHHLTAPHPQGRGLITAITQALKQANIAPSDIAFVNAHGTATPDNDRVESIALHQLFGNDLQFTSTKSYTGHTLGAAGGLEAVFAMMGLEQNFIPATLGYQNKDEELPIAPVSQRAEVHGQYALSTSLAFGGNNSALILRKVQS